MTLLRLAGVGALLLALIGCATAPPAPASPRLRLSPASLGTTLALQQQLTVTVADQTHSLEVLLEADPQAVRVAVLSLGQTAARLEWDGAKLTQSRAAWWPDTVSAERILDDMQLMLWPAAAVSAGLPPGWSLASSEGLRVLSRDGQAVVHVRYEGPNISELVHLRQGYRVRVQSRVLEAAQ
jgi:hypothetical protein